MIDATRLADLVIRIQDEFFATVDLALTAQAAGDRFGVDERTCASVLDFLADAAVLMKRSDGAYVRFVRAPRQPTVVHSMAPKSPAVLIRPRSVAFITPRELARIAHPVRRVA